MVYVYKLRVFLTQVWYVGIAKIIFKLLQLLIRQLNYGTLENLMLDVRYKQNLLRVRISETLDLTLSMVNFFSHKIKTV